MQIHHKCLDIVTRELSDNSRYNLWLADEWRVTGIAVL